MSTTSSPSYIATVDINTTYTIIIKVTPFIPLTQLKGNEKGQTTQIRCAVHRAMWQAQCLHCL